MTEVDDTWENFFGSSPDLMPSIMGAFDAIVGSKEDFSKTSTPKRVHPVNSFAVLSPNVQKILSNVSDQEIANSEERLTEFANRRAIPGYRSLRSPEKNLNRSVENLEISANVQKMLSNLPDTEVVVMSGKKVKNGSSFYVENVERDKDCLEDKKSDTDADCGLGKPLGSYLHTNPQGIASRTPVGRKNLGKYLQVPSEGSVGTTSSTASSEVSRPVSLTSLGSCSSSSSSGPHPPDSTYLASTESLNSDPEPTGSQGSADSGIAEPLPASPEMRVLEEVLESERVYVADLNEVIQGYLLPWRADSECPLASYLQHLFSNLEEIHKFNKCFLEDLQRAECDPIKTSMAFLSKDSGFSVYNEYCTNYPRTMDILVKLTRDESMAKLFRERQKALNHALPLGSYLLKPVQRILKYHLLLQRLSKQCDPKHKPTVDLALKTMTTIAADINNMKRKHEHAVRVQEIQAQLYGWTGPDLTALGELIAEGNFRVIGARGRRHVFLFDKVLLLAKSKQDGGLCYKQHIMCSNLMLVEQVRGEPLSFHVLPFDNPRLQCTLKARSPQHKREWTLQIKRVILENYNVQIPNHARQLVMQLGQDIGEDVHDSNEKWSPLNKFSTPHYLERRSRVRKCKDLGRRAASQDRSFLLGTWRRKSEPGVVAQFNSKTIPKKSKKKESNSTFYTDLSDSESCEIERSNESLAHATESLQDVREEQVMENNEIKTNLEKIVSDLLMQNQEFYKIFNRPQNRRNINSEPGPSILFEERLKMPSKADSLPRCFQLNDQVESEESHKCDEKLEVSSKEVQEGQQENDLSRVEDSEHPDHKIYRRTAIRFSLLQRIKTILEDQKGGQKYPLHKQGSKSMGEKIAHPDYADPQKLILSSRNSSLLSLSQETKSEGFGERNELDMSLNEAEVLNELDKRLEKSSHEELNSISSSQNSDSYYESILEKSLTEEYFKDENGKLIAKQDSFGNHDSKTVLLEKYRNAKSEPVKNSVRRPNKAPPPIPQKPAKLINNKLSSKTESNLNSLSYCNESFRNHSNGSNISWVKTVVNRFE